MNVEIHWQKTNHLYKFRSICNRSRDLNSRLLLFRYCSIIQISCDELSSTFLSVYSKI